MSYATDKKLLKFQSTRPRGRTRHGIYGGSAEYAVSIHASSREDATASHLMRAASVGFNPRVLAGGRDTAGGAVDDLWRVSIHASSREDATCTW